MQTIMRVLFSILLLSGTFIPLAQAVQTGFKAEAVTISKSESPNQIFQSEEVEEPVEEDEETTTIESE